jgi:hypothetical protein
MHVSVMTTSVVSTLASIPAARPVFMIVMGVCLVLFVWRLVKARDGWAARLMISGALLLAFGYCILLPLYDAGKIPGPSHPQADASMALAWHAVKLAVMNFGWLFFGIGLSMHARLFRIPSAPRPSTTTATATAVHESVA